MAKRGWGGWSSTAGCSVAMAGARVPEDKIVRGSFHRRPRARRQAQAGAGPGFWKPVFKISKGG